MMNELNDIAGQHEMIAENLVTQIISDLTQLILSLRQDRKRVRPTLILICLFIFYLGLRSQPHAQIDSRGVAVDDSRDFSRVR